MSKAIFGIINSSKKPNERLQKTILFKSFQDNFFLWFTCFLEELRILIFFLEMNWLTDLVSNFKIIAALNWWVTCSYLFRTFNYNKSLESDVICDRITKNFQYGTKLTRYSPRKALWPIDQNWPKIMTIFFSYR